LNVDDTIVAIASAPGGAWRGIVRVSGPDTVPCVARCFRSRSGDDLFAVRRASLIEGRLELIAPLGEVPCDLYLWPGPRSYTRQPVAEFHTIGSSPVLEGAVRALEAAGARLAEPGEFTLRAFLAGRLDLTQAEAVLGMIDARNRKEFDTAIAQLAGGLARPFHQLREQLLALLAHVEAGLDFVDEDIEFISPHQLQDRLRQAGALAARIADQMASRSESTHEFRVVLMGWPNVGKSSLMNALVGQQAALVSDVAGTTRDYLTQLADIHGLTCQLIDTAGREEDRREGIAGMAQRLSNQQSQRAHVELLCLDATRRINAWERRILQTAQPENRLLVVTKIDGVRSTDLHLEAIETSSRTGAGLADLKRAIFNCITEGLESGSFVTVTSVRCRQSLRAAGEALRRARHAAVEHRGEEIVAAEIRAALDEVGKVVGAVYTDDILAHIFSRFCLGK
jgi:tRNA modification GTPase